MSYKIQEALLLQDMLKAAPAELMADPVMKAISTQVLGRVEKDEGTRMLLRSFLDKAARDWPLSGSLVCPKCNMLVPFGFGAEGVFCETCKMPYYFVKG